MALPTSVTVTWTTDGLIIVPSETDVPVTPPVTPPTTEGIQAKRISDLIELFGVNTFSSMDEHNTWGSWPADYKPESVIAALKYIVGDSGFALRIREYHYSNKYAMQAEWLPKIVSAFPGTKVSLCPGANMNISDVETMLDLSDNPANGIIWLEGLNEPNTDFGSGQVPVETTMAIQNGVWRANSARKIMGPSIVAGMPHPEGWITGYFGNQMDTVNTLMHEGNGHYYPPGNPDVPATGWSINEYIGGLWTVYAQKSIHLTEFHPTLYNSEGNKPDQPGWSGDRDAYYTLLTLLRCGKNGTQGLWWYALFDYGTQYKCGLFPTDNENNPRPVADALKTLCTICADRGDRHNFTTEKLAIEITGLTSAIDYDVYQTSDKAFIVPIWYSANENAAEVNVHITLAKQSIITVYNPLDVNDPIKTADATTMDLNVLPGIFILVIDQ